jgi:hypothetical protein
MPIIIRLMDVLLIWIAGYVALNLRQVTFLPAYLPENFSGYYSLIAGAGVIFLVISREVYRSWRGAAMPLMLARVTGTGHGGRITREDVLGYVAVAGSSPSAAPDPAAGVPPPIAFAKQARSGCTPYRSIAPPSATVAPDFTSSKMNTTPCLVQSSRIASR